MIIINIINVTCYSSYYKMSTITSTSATSAAVASAIPSSAGKRWSSEEDQRLLQYAATKSHEQLAKDHGRTVLAIRMRLMLKLHEELEALDYFREPQSNYQPGDVSDDNINKVIVTLQVIMKYGKPTKDQLHAYHAYEMYRRKAAATRKLVNSSTTGPQAIDLEINPQTEAALLNIFKSKFPSSSQSPIADVTDAPATEAAEIVDDSVEMSSDKSQESRRQLLIDIRDLLMSLIKSATKY